MARGYENTPATVLYDRDCGFCRWALAKVLAWDRRRTLRPVPIQSPEGDRLLSGMAEEQRLASWHLATGDGSTGDQPKIRSGGAALAPLFRMLPGAGIPARLAEKLPGAADRGYRWIASNRSKLGKPVTDGAKRRADARIEARS
jgi:predicted DCC family thiol-disulfide oxidoreductase YuxK